MSVEEQHVFEAGDVSIARMVIDMPLAETYTSDKAKPAEKDGVMQRVLPDTVTECSLCARRSGEDVCSSPGIVAKIASAIGISADTGSTEVVKAAEEKLGVKTEREVLVKLASKIGPEEVKRELSARFKVTGPINTEILSNREIEAVLSQFESEFGTFRSLGFNMLNYRQYSFVHGRVIAEPDTLATTDFAELYKRGYRTCGCVINSDVYQGPGKHWMALFADARGKAKWSVEFFNSSGRAPAREWCDWLEQTRRSMKTIDGCPPKIKVCSVTAIKQQKTRTECGLYSLTYIWSRLIGVPPEYFMKTPIPDQLALESRYHYFVTPEYIHKFDWREFVRKNSISWE